MTGRRPVSLDTGWMGKARAYRRGRVATNGLARTLAPPDAAKRLSRRRRIQFVAFTLDYDQMVILDAEELAEEGIAAAYARLLPKLRKYVRQPARIEDVVDDDTAAYSVRCGGREYPIYGPGLPDENGEAWDRATIAFFAFVNDQLASTPYRFYAINGGNDLGGMFLTPAQAYEARASLPRPLDWPYLPQDNSPGCGQFH